VSSNISSKNRITQEICAVKIIEVDSQDYKADIDARDDTIKEFIRETTILQSLKDNKAKNVNIIYDAFSVDSQLWIVSEYCPGGSLSTLMKATVRPGLEEAFIIPISRECAVALKYVHEAGIIHRDIKCANILVTEDGRIQLCDFGISGVLENEVSKRSTIIGTPHWMAPELVSRLGSDDKSIQYGTEIDCWAFGCAVYEMATGHPPNSRVRPGDLGALLMTETPHLEGDSYSAGLQDFVAFCLEEHPEKRPSAGQIIGHKYVADTSKDFPTESIRKLIEYYAKWEQSGGQRASLFNPYGAQAPDPLSPSDDLGEEWNFSTTMEFDRRLSMGIDPFSGNRSKKSRELTKYEKAFEEASVSRGGAGMQGIFDHDEKPYVLGESSRRISDLPLRNLDNGPTVPADRTTLIDLDAVIPSFDLGPNLDLADVPTIRAKKFLQQLDDEEEDVPYAFNNQDSNRKTQDWKFPSYPVDENPNRRTQDWTFPQTTVTDSDAPTLTAGSNSRTSRKILKESELRNRRTQDWKFPTADEFDAIAHDMPSPRTGLVHAATMPVNTYNDYPRSVASSPDRSSMIDLDQALQVHIPDIRRPSTADSNADSAMTDTTSGDPFDLEDQIQLSQTNNRGSLHMKSQSEPTAGFPASKQEGKADGETSSDVSVGHNRSSSMTRSDRERSSSRPRGVSARYRQQRPSTLQRRWEDNEDSSDLDANNNIRYDPFSEIEEDTLGEERQGWEERLAGAQARRQNGSNGLMRTPISNEGDELEGGTLRPRGGGGSGVIRTETPQLPQLQMPRVPNMAALLPNASNRLMADELGGLYENLAIQADILHAYLSSMGPLGDNDDDEWDPYADEDETV
jgi:protein-serine/threonine kinase